VPAEPSIGVPCHQFWNPHLNISSKETETLDNSVVSGEIERNLNLETGHKSAISYQSRIKNPQTASIWVVFFRSVNVKATEKTNQMTIPMETNQKKMAINIETALKIINNNQSTRDELFLCRLKFKMAPIEPE